MKRSRQDLLLGLVFFAGLAGLILATLVLTNVRFVDQSEQREVHFPDVGQLQEGDTVEVLGHRFGLVEAIEFRQGDVPVDERFLVRLRLDRPLTIQNGYTVKIREASLLGGRAIEIDPGSQPPEFGADTTLTGIVEKSALEGLGELVSDPEFGDNIREILRNVAAVTRNLNEGDGLIARLINDPAIPDQIERILDSVASVTGDLENATDPSSQSLLGRVLNDSGLGRTVQDIVDNIDQVLSPQGDGLVARLLHGDELRDRIDRMIADLQTAVSPEGTGVVASALHDQDLDRDATDLVAGLRTAVDKVNDPNSGALGYLFSDPKSAELVDSILERVDDAVATVDDILVKANQGDGLIATLLNDEDLSEQFSRVLNQVARAVEDAREAAPVSTFVSVLIAAF